MKKKNRGIIRLISDAVDLPRGVYLYQVKAGSFIETRKVDFVEIKDKAGGLPKSSTM